MIAEVPRVEDQARTASAPDWRATACRRPRLRRTGEELLGLATGLSWAAVLTAGWVAALLQPSLAARQRADGGPDEL